MTAVTIRPYRPADLEPCRALWAELTEHHRALYDDPSIGGQDPGRHFDRHLALVGAERIWVAERGRVVGLVGLVVEGQEAEIEPIVVTAGEQGQGIGHRLLSRAVEEAGRLGLRYLSVRPVARNARAIALFHRAGFRLLGRIELCMDLQAGEGGGWRPGPELSGCTFEI